MYRQSGKLYKAEGIILSRKNYGETDRIITIFTKEYGKLRAIAKGVRRITSRRGPHLEVFTRAEFMLYKGNTLDSVSEVNPLDTFEHLRSNLKQVGIAYLYCELVSSLLADRQEHSDIYELLRFALVKLDAGEAVATDSREFTLELLWTLGFLPRNKRLTGAKLEAFVESVTERRLKTPKLVRKLLT